MGVNIEKIKTCCHAVITFIGNILTLKFPLWLYIVVSLAFVLWCSFISCTRDRALQRVVVGHAMENGHKYVFFRDEKSGESLAVLHDPDCDCYFTEIVIPDESN